MKDEKQKKRVSLLIELLNSFTEKEIEKFTPLVSCTYFNTDQYVSRLFAIIKEKIWRRKTYDAAMQYEVYCKVFPKRPASTNMLGKEEKTLLNAKISLLTRLAETFLSLEALEKKPACKTELLQDELLARKQFLLFNRNVKKDKKQADKRGVQDIDYHNHYYKIEQGVLNHLHQSGQLADSDNLPLLNYHLDIYYIISKLSLHLTALSLSEVSDKKSYDFSPMKSVLALAELHNYAQHPLIQVYLVIVKMMEERDEEAYKYLLELLEQYESSIHRKDLGGFYTIAAVFCARQIVRGNLMDHRNLFELYQVMHNKDLLREGEFMDIHKLKNLVTLSCRVQEFDWATDVIENYRTSIDQPIRKSVCHFNLGAIAFYQNDYKTAISHFIRVDKIEGIGVVWGVGVIGYWDFLFFGIWCFFFFILLSKPSHLFFCHRQ